MNNTGKNTELRYVTQERAAALLAFLRKSFRGFRRSPDWATKNAPAAGKQVFTRTKSYGRFAR